MHEFKHDTYTMNLMDEFKYNEYERYEMYDMYELQPANFKDLPQILY